MEGAFGRWTCANAGLDTLCSLQQGVRFDPDIPQTIRLEFAKSNTKVSKPKQQLSPPAAATHPTLVHPLTGRKYTPITHSFFPPSTFHSPSPLNLLLSFVLSFLLLCSISFHSTYCSRDFFTAFLLQLILSRYRYANGSFTSYTPFQYFQLPLVSLTYVCCNRCYFETVSLGGMKGPRYLISFGYYISDIYYAAFPLDN